MKAQRIYWHKSRLQERYVIELSIHEIGDPVKYPDGVKYGLVCIDLLTEKKVLMDNHHPKGPHIHLNEIELSYSFKNVTDLINDFKKLVLEHLEIKL